MEEKNDPLSLEKSSGFDIQDIMAYDGKPNGLHSFLLQNKDPMYIYGLYFYHNESFETPYLEMVSLDKTILEEKCLSVKDNKCYQDGILMIEPVHIFLLNKVKNKDMFPKKYNILFGKESNLLLTLMIQNKDMLDYPNVYVMNYFFIRDGIEHIAQVLLKIEYDTSSTQTMEEFIKELREEFYFQNNNFSKNSIKFDTYYNESMINN